MSHFRILWLAIALLGLAALACQAFQQELEPTIPPLPTIDLGNLPTVTATGLPDGEATTTATAGVADLTPPAAGEPTVTVLVDLNVRTGPGTQFDRISVLRQGQSALIVGVDAATGWWKIRCPANAAGDECWISGSSQFSRSENAAGVPIAAAPPTPTPPPTETPTPTPTATATPEPLAAPTTPIIAYIDGGDVWLRPLTVSGTSLTAGLPVRLTSRGNINQLFIAPDGRHVAYLGARGDANYLGLVAIDGSGDRDLVTPASLPPSGPDVVNVIGQVQWLADSTTLLFNTNFVGRTGPGFASNNDLWRAPLAGGVAAVLPSGQGGGAFDAARRGPGLGKVILVADSAVIRANSDGSGREQVITFPFINTASEYVYYARPQWTANGSVAYVAIPDPEPFRGPSDPPVVTLWRIPPNGPAAAVGTLTGNVLFNPITWSPEGNYLAYVRQVPGVTPRLLLANGGGGDVTPTSAEDDNLAFLDWHPNEFNFLYRTSGGHALGIVGSLDIPVASPAGQTTTAARWLTAVHYIYIEGASPAWNVRAGNLSGGTAALFGVTGGNPPVFELWTP